MKGLYNLTIAHDAVVVEVSPEFDVQFPDDCLQPLVTILLAPHGEGSD